MIEIYVCVDILFWIACEWAVSMPFNYNIVFFIIIMDDESGNAAIQNQMTTVYYNNQPKSMYGLVCPFC